MARIGTRRALLYRPAAAGTPYLLFDGNDSVNCGSGATLDDLHAGAFTVEMWAFATTSANWRTLASKSGYVGHAFGWEFRVQSGGTAIRADIYAETTAAYVQSGSVLSTDGTWKHVALTYDNTGSRLVSVWANGTQIAGSTATVGNVWSDAAYNFVLGSLLVGGIGWVRVSNIVRYTGAFTPDARNAPPAADANTRLLLKMDAGSGNPQDSSGNGNHGTISGATWVVS